MGAAKRDFLKVRLIIEEMLLIYKDALSENSKFVFSMRKKTEEISYRLSIRGASFDPSVEKSALLEVLNLFDDNIGDFISWTYENNSNHINFAIPIHTTSGKNRQFFLKYLKHQKKPFIIAAIAQMINVIVNIVFPMVNAQVIIAFTDNALEQVFSFNV